jgi:hypothetical protein
LVISLTVKTGFKISLPQRHSDFYDTAIKIFLWLLL